MFSSAQSLSENYFNAKFSENNKHTRKQENMPHSKEESKVAETVPEKTTQASEL